MSHLIDEPDCSVTPIGAPSLRRRDPRLGVDEFEAMLGDDFLMTSHFTASEVALGRDHGCGPGPALAASGPGGQLKKELGQCLAGRLFLPCPRILAPRDAPDPGGAPCHAGAAVLYRSQALPSVVLFLTVPCALPPGGSGAARAGRPGQGLWEAWRGTDFRSQG